MTGSRSRMHRGMFPSPWIVVATAGILLLVVVTLAVRNINREKEHMSRILNEKGAALIKAFEAGTRCRTAARHSNSTAFSSPFRAGAEGEEATVAAWGAIARRLSARRATRRRRPATGVSRRTPKRATR